MKLEEIWRLGCIHQGYLFLMQETFCIQLTSIVAVTMTWSSHFTQTTIFLIIPKLFLLLTLAKLLLLWGRFRIYSANAGKRFFMWLQVCRFSQNILYIDASLQMCLLFLLVELGHFFHFAVHQTSSESAGALGSHTLFPLCWPAHLWMLMMGGEQQQEDCHSIGLDC